MEETKRDLEFFSQEPVPVSMVDGRISPARVLAPLRADVASFKPPDGLLVAGFPYAGGASTDDIDENLVDTVVAWSSFGNAAGAKGGNIECVVELDWRSMPSADECVFLAAAGEFSLALAGPRERGEWLAPYCERLEELVSSMLKRGNYSKSLYPFSILFEIFFLDAMGKTNDAERMRDEIRRGLSDTTRPSGARREYAIRRTPLGFPEVEASCKRALLGHFGSEEEFARVAGALAAPVARRIVSFTNETLTAPKARDERLGMANEQV